MRCTYLMMIALVTGLGFPSSVAAQCPEGPNSAGNDAIRSAANASEAIAAHVDLIETDEEGRRLMSPDESADRRGQVSLKFVEQDVAGFVVCDSTAWRRAELSHQDLGATIGVPLGKIGRLEGRLMGVSDSIRHSDADAYRPDRGEPDVRLPGATGAGYGIWSLRLQLLDWASLTVGRIGEHTISHRVGWDESYDEDGEFAGWDKSNTADWGTAVHARTFVAIGSPRYGGTDVVVGEDGLDRFNLRSPYIALSRRHPVDGLAFVGWDGIDEAWYGGLESMTRLPSPIPLWWRARGAVGATSEAPVREASVSLETMALVPYRGRQIPLLYVKTDAGLVGSRRIAATGRQALVGASASGGLNIPLIALFRIGGWVGVNRARTVTWVPQAAGRVDYGLDFYATVTL